MLVSIVYIFKIYAVLLHGRSELAEERVCYNNLVQRAQCCPHRHLSNVDYLMARTSCLVCFNSTVNGHSKKKKPWKIGAVRVNRRMGKKFAQILEKVAQTVAKAKNDKISKSKLDLKVQNIYMKSFLTLKIPKTNNIFTQKITQAFKK
jgi:hypothetical protein